DERRFGTDEGYGLTLHVRTHERTVRVVVLKERDERCGNGNELLWGNVDVVDRVRGGHDEVPVLAAGDQFVSETSALVEHGVRLCDGVLTFFDRREVNHFAGDLATSDFAVRCFDKAVFVDARVGRHGVDQTDIRTFRRFNRADTAIVGRVHV